MKIEKNVVVSVAYQVKLEDGVVVDQSTAEAPLDYLHGHNNLITGLEKSLKAKLLVTSSLQPLLQKTLTASTTTL